MLYLGVIAIVAGLWQAFWPTRKARAAEERIESGEDAYFEQRRELEAYPSLRDPKRIRIRGLIVLAAGIAIIAMELFERR